MSAHNVPLVVIGAGYSGLVGSALMAAALSPRVVWL